MPLRPNMVLGIMRGLLLALVLVLLGAADLRAGGEGLVLDARLDGGKVDLTATLTDARRRPIANAEITFDLRTVFGWLAAARAATDAEGRARTTLAVLGNSRIEVRATAVIGEATVSETAALELTTMPTLQTRPGEAELSTLVAQPGLVSPHPPLRLLLVLMPILLGVWVTYAVVVYQLFGIARNR